MILSKRGYPTKTKLWRRWNQKNTHKNIMYFLSRVITQTGSAVALPSMINFPYLILGNNFILCVRASGVTCLFLFNFGTHSTQGRLPLHYHQFESTDGSTVCTRCKSQHYVEKVCQICATTTHWDESKAMYEVGFTVSDAVWREMPHSNALLLEINHGFTSECWGPRNRVWYGKKMQRKPHKSSKLFPLLVKWCWSYWGTTEA